MKYFFEKNKLFFMVVIGAVIIGAGGYFSSQNYSEVNQRGNDNYFINNPPVHKNTPKVDNDIKCLANSEVLATKVIDGDTIVVEGGYHIRLLGVDADEVGYPCYKSAKNRLEELVLNEKIRLEKDKTDIDKYKRCLRYVFLDKQSINLQLIKEGLAVARFYESDVKYKNEITLAEKTAIDEKVGCKWKNR